jgi:hypothetical protein
VSVRPGGSAIGTWLTRGVIVVGALLLLAVLLVTAFVVGEAVVRVTDLRTAQGVSQQNAPAPHVAAYAQSGPVRHADARTATWFDRQLAQLRREAPWLRPVGYSLFDNCGAQPRTAPDGATTGWDFECQRDQVSYFAFAGDGTRAAELERALTRMGWGGISFTPARTFPGQPALSAMLTAAYPPPGLAGNTGMRITWFNPAQRRDLAAYVRFVIPTRNSLQYPVQVVPPDLGQISRAAAGPGRSLVSVELISDYVTPAA